MLSTLEMILTPCQKKFKAPQIPNDLNVGYENYIVEDPSDTSTLEPLLDALAENNIDVCIPEGACYRVGFL